jgi:hypothetical protein
MILRSVFLVQLLCQAMMGWIPHLSPYCQMRVGSYGYIPLCHVPKAAASRGPERTMLIRCGKPTGTFDRGPGSLP